MGLRTLLRDAGLAVTGVAAPRADRPRVAPTGARRGGWPLARPGPSASERAGPPAGPGSPAATPEAPPRALPGARRAPIGNVRGSLQPVAGEPRPFPRPRVPKPQPVGQRSSTRSFPLELQTDSLPESTQDPRARGTPFQARPVPLQTSCCQLIPLRCAHLSLTWDAPGRWLTLAATGILILSPGCSAPGFFHKLE